MMTYKRSEPCPRCGNRTFAHQIVFEEGALDAKLVPTCLSCKWTDTPRDA